MSGRALSFVEEWISEHVRAEGYEPEGDNLSAKALGFSCLQDASAEGISEAEIKESIDDLTDFMARAIKEANDQEVRRLAEKDD